MYYEKLQIADTSFKTHEQLKMFQQPDSQLFMNNIYYSQWKTSQNILKNIQQEHRFRKSNTLIVNETQLKTKQFPFKIVHLITLIHSTFRFLQQAKIAVSDCKTKQFLLQANGLQVFPGKKSLSKSTFKYLTTTADRLGCPPNVQPFSSPMLHIPFSFLRMLTIG